MKDLKGLVAHEDKIPTFHLERDMEVVAVVEGMVQAVVDSEVRYLIY